jgi:hypothetical protein
MPSAAMSVPLMEVPLEFYPEPVDVLADIRASERGAIARRIGAIVAQFQRESNEGAVSLSDVELRLVLLADDVRGGLHGKAG